MIWLICELNGIGYRFTSCNSMEEAESNNYELWNYRFQFGNNNTDELEAFLMINSYKSYRIRDGKKSSFGNPDGRFTTCIISQKKFNYFSDDFIKKINIQQTIIESEYYDKLDYAYSKCKNDVLFKNEYLVTQLGKVAGKRFNMYSYKTKNEEKPIELLTSKTQNKLINKVIHFQN
ncbi:hypothetical protein KU06062604_780015 [Flavobacterium psychrophilum]|uniref:hypothetical protein n=1 Tax=Flavobacterium psychrophilum TaxID=96345 RepID=UPI000B7C3D62|nr:hypothetical protein [Flavobacterium psychrophilum]SNB22516.1 hypothetical protein KU06062604_780015 [Flavobacterium psychrophilum]